MSSVQPGGFDGCDKELGSIGVGTCKFFQNRVDEYKIVIDTNRGSTTATKIHRFYASWQSQKKISQYLICKKLTRIGHTQVHGTFMLEVEILVLELGSKNAVAFTLPVVQERQRNSFC